MPENISARWSGNQWGRLRRGETRRSAVTPRVTDSSSRLEASSCGWCRTRWNYSRNVHGEDTTFLSPFPEQKRNLQLRRKSLPRGGRLRSLRLPVWRFSVRACPPLHLVPVEQFDSVTNRDGHCVRA